MRPSVRPLPAWITQLLDRSNATTRWSLSGAACMRCPGRRQLSAEFLEPSDADRGLRHSSRRRARGPGRFDLGCTQFLAHRSVAFLVSKPDCNEATRRPPGCGSLSVRSGHGKSGPLKPPSDRHGRTKLSGCYGTPDCHPAGLNRSRDRPNILPATVSAAFGRVNSAACAEALPHCRA